MNAVDPNTEPTTAVEVPSVEEAAPVPTPVLSTPDITKAQLVGVVPIVATLLKAFGVYTLTADQTSALELAVGSGVALFAADALIRLGRNINRAKG